MTRVLILGDKGQLGSCLHDTVDDSVELTGFDIDQIDITDKQAVTELIREQKPDWLINSAAFTAVDKAEAEEALAHRVNSDAVRFMAEACKEVGCRMVHISTDFVFDGLASTPYMPESVPAPVSVYGSTKLSGEQELTALLPDSSFIIRTAWLYSEYGNNFVKTMLGLMAEKDELGVVADQRGTPTYARGLAEAIWQLVMAANPEAGIYHWTDAGETSWHGFATAIQTKAVEQGMLKIRIPVNAVTTAEYPTPATRPTYSVLNCEKLRRATGKPGQPWEQALDQMLANYKNMV